jgi:hypothetical protein
MSERVDAEQKRDEQRILEQRLQLQRMEVKRHQAAQSFQSVVSQVAQSKRQESQKNDGKQMQQNTANQRLMARRGIDNNDFSQKMFTDGNGRLLKGRDTNKGKDAELGMRRAQQDKATEIFNNKSATPPPVQRQPHGKDSRKKDEGQGRNADEARRELVMGSHSGQSLMPLAGVAPQQGSGGASATAPNVQRILDEIVKAVQKGVDAKGMGVMHIELKDHVLSGASLSIHTAADGITLKIRTPDEQVGRLLSSGSTAHELSNALRSKNITLKGLEVNDTKVIR